MQIFTDTKIPFMAQRKFAMIFSGILLIVALVSLVFKGMHFGLDFTGGTIIEISYPDAVILDPIRKAIARDHFKGAVVQHFGSAKDVLIRVPPNEKLSSAQVSSKLLQLLEQQNPKVSMRRVEYVGPQVGDELTETGGLAMLAALGCILIYVALRFEYRFALGAVAALIHDVIIVLGFFSLFSREFDLTVLAAVLAVIGYSLNDTIVVFDRIRENFRTMRKDDAIPIIDTSLNQTLSRTLMTSFTTFLVLVALFLFGGALIHGFATALLVGVIIGTYSSIYVASSILVSMGVSKKDLAPVKKEGAEQEEIYEEV